MRWGGGWRLPDPDVYLHALARCLKGRDRCRVLVQVRSAVRVRVADVRVPRYVDCQERYQRVQRALGWLKMRKPFTSAVHARRVVVNITR